MITGYNLPHLDKFSIEELNLLSNSLPKGLTYRMYGGEESRGFVLSDKMIEFITTVEGKVILVIVNRYAAQTHTRMLEDAGISVEYEYENEQYIFPPPTIFQFRDWIDFNFNKAKYYERLAQRHLADYAAQGKYYSLPAQVNQNVGYKAYAKVFLNSIMEFTIDLHVFGDDPAQLRGNLQWYKDNARGRKISVLEFNGLRNDRRESLFKNTAYHSTRHAQLINIINEYSDEVLYFTLAANPATQNWNNPSYLHKYYVDTVVVNEIWSVWS